MATIRQVYKNIHAVKFDRVVKETILQHKTNMVDLNRDQMLDGYNKNLQRIGAYASEQYEREKRSMNPSASGWVDLKYTGEFQSKMDLRMPNNREYELFSKDSKNNDLVEKYGENIFGLSSKSREELIEEYGFRTSLVNNYKKAAKLI